MKFAFSTQICPQWDPGTVAARVREFGYDGIDIADTEADRFAGVEVPVCCMGSPAGFVGNKAKDQAAADDIRRAIDAAQKHNCSLVRIPAAPVRPGQNPATVGVAFSGWLAPLGEYACDRRVTLVVENTGGFRAARDLWTVLERVNHPAVACAWDVLAATPIESPAVSVPVLNSRIQHAYVTDARITSAGAEPCPLGQGAVPVRQFIIRLRGIGYPNWVTVRWDPSAAPSLDPQTALPEALKLLKQWNTEGIAVPKPAKPAPAAHKPAPAPKPAPAAAS